MYPGRFKKSLKSWLRCLQQLHSLPPSWNKGCTTQARLSTFLYRKPKNTHRRKSDYENRKSEVWGTWSHFLYWSLLPTATHLFIHLVGLPSKWCKHDLAKCLRPLIFEWKWGCLWSLTYGGLQLPTLKFNKKFIHNDKNLVSTDLALYPKWSFHSSIVIS